MVNDSKKEVGEANIASKYYYEHFMSLHDRVKCQYSDLLTKEDLNFYRAFSALGVHARYLLIRLLLRKGVYFNVDKIHYSDIDNAKDAFEELIDSGFLTKDPDISMENLFSLFTKREWVEFLNTNLTDGVVCKHSDSRSVVYELVKRHVDKNTVFQKKRLVELNAREWLRNLQFFYFGNIRQTLSELILSDLNIRNFESYELNNDNRLFDCQESFRLLLLINLVGQITSVLSANKKEVSSLEDTLRAIEFNDAAAVLPIIVESVKRLKYFDVYVFESDVVHLGAILQSWLDKQGLTAKFSGSEQISLYWFLFKVLESIDDCWKRLDKNTVNEVLASKFYRRCRRAAYVIGFALEQLGRLQEALMVYRFSGDAQSVEREIRVLAKLAYNNQALQLCSNVLNREVNSGIDVNESLQEFAESFGHRMTRKNSYQYWPKPKRYEPNTVSLILDKPEDVRMNSGAEQAVISYMESNKTEFFDPDVKIKGGEGKCFFVENNLLMTVFSLVYWPLFYADIKGAFTHPFQLLPHDIYDSTFLEKRLREKSEIDSNILSECYLPVDTLMKTLIAKKDCRFILAGLNAIDSSCLTQALTRIPTQHWQALFDRLWLDLREHRKGLPDLVYFPPEETNALNYCFIEVKAPNDRLQDHQRRWMKYFNQYNIRHYVVNVEWNNRDAQPVEG